MTLSTICILIVIVALALWATFLIPDSPPPNKSTLRKILQVAIVVLAIIYLLRYL